MSQRLVKRLAGAQRLAVLAVGSDLRCDDAAGLLAGKELQSLTKDFSGPPAVQVFIGGTAPENVTGPLKAFKPTHLIVLDAASLGRRPGSVEIIDPFDVANSGSFSTHSLPLNVLTGYLAKEIGCAALILAIQPGSCEFGCSPGRAVRAAAKRAAKAVLRAIAK